jgi:hypothetical protein
MVFKRRRPHQAGAEPAPHFEHASGYTDLAGVLGDHTLDAEQEAAATAPKGYRNRTVTNDRKPRRP